MRYAMEGTNSKIMSNSLMRGLLVLECFSPEKPRWSLAELAPTLGMPRSSLFRIVKTLLEMGFLRYDDRSKRYSLGTRVLSLGFSVLQGMELRELARPHIESLSNAFDKTVNLAVLDKFEMVYIERVKVPGYRDFNMGIGSRVPVWNTAIGCSVLAYLPEAKLVEVVEKLRQVHDFEASGGEERLAAHLRQVRQDGFAINERTLFKKWIRAIAAPVFSGEGVVCSINIVVEPEEVSVEELRNTYAPVLLKAVEDLSSALGYRGSNWTQWGERRSKTPL
jgi:IclR family transcriptional regulator, pca regulon regulatory protein